MSPKTQSHTFDRLVLLRGGAFANSMDAVGSLIVTVGNETTAEPSLASLITIQIAKKNVTVKHPQAPIQVFDLENGIDFLMVPQDVCTSLKLPMIAVWSRAGVASSEVVNSSLDLLASRNPVILVGACNWIDGAFFASPFGVRNGDGSWSHFAASGGVLGISMSLPLENHDGRLLQDMTRDITQPRTLNAVVDGFAMRAPKQGDLGLYCPCASVADAIALVILRKAWGAIRGPIFIPTGVSAGWKRLVQHIGCDVKEVEIIPDHAESLDIYSKLFPKFHQEDVLVAIQKNGQVIPENLSREG